MPRIPSWCSITATKVNALGFNGAVLCTDSCPRKQVVVSCGGHLGGTSLVVLPWLLLGRDLLSRGVCLAESGEWDPQVQVGDICLGRNTSGDT